MGSASRSRTARPNSAASGRGSSRVSQTGARPASPKSSRTSRRSAEARCRAVFNAFVLLVVILAGVGLARVAVVAQAAEMTLSANRLETDIKAQRAETDQLEIDRSALATPSRIEGIASTAMRMVRPAPASPLLLSPAKASAPSGDQANAARASQSETAQGEEIVRFVAAAFTELSAGEAQTLLVGDVGLAGSR